MSEPKISIVIITSDQRARAERCLQAVLCQAGLDRAEVLLYDLAAGRLPALKGCEHPAVRLIPAAPSATFDELRAEAVQAARGELLAYVEDHTLVLPGWLTALINDCEQPYAGFGAVPIFVNPEHGITDILELMHYIDFEGLHGRHESPGLPGHNPAYRRALLLSFGDDLLDLLSCEFLLEQRVQAQGLKLLIDPAVGFLHLNIESASDLYQVCYLRDRVFGAVRARSSGWGVTRRGLQLLAAPAMPFIRLGRAIRKLRQANPAKLAVLRRYLGIFLISQLYAGVGRGMGALFGEKDARRGVTQYELNRLRFTLPASDVLPAPET